MENLQSTENKQDKELDLVDIFKSIWNFLVKYLFGPLIYLIRLGLKKWYYFAIAVAVGILLAFVMPYITSKKYSIFMLVRNNVQLSSDFVNKIKITSSEGPLAWQQALNITGDELSSLKGFDAHHVYARDSSFIGYMIDFKDEKFEKKGIIYPDLFAVEFQVTDTTMMQKLQTSAWTFLNSDSYINFLNAGRLDMLRAQKRMLSNEMILLDSLRHFEYFEKNRNALTLQSAYKDGLVVKEEPTRLMHNDMIALTTEYNDVKNRLEMHPEPIELVIPMQIRGAAINDWTRTIVYYCLATIVLTYIILLIVTFRKEIGTFIRK